MMKKTAIIKNLILSCITIIICNVSFAQLTGTKTIPGDYSSIADAITDLNTQGVGTGGVIFSIVAGYTETFSSRTSGYITSNTGTASNQIKFIKAGSGSNPKITAAIGAGTMDAIICFCGVKYITFDKIDLYENTSNTTSTTQMEWGYALLRTSATQGSQYITIMNCTISLNKSNSSSVGIYSGNHTYTTFTQLTINSSTGQNSNNNFYGNNITNSYIGIYLIGYLDPASPYSNYDQNNDIGSLLGDTITNFAGGSVTAYAIYVAYQNELTIANCKITGGNGSTGNLYGIYGGTANKASASIYGNRISLVSAATTNDLNGIYNAGIGKSGTNNTLSIYNNTVKNCSCPNITYGRFYGIYNNSSAYTISMYGDTVTNNILGGNSNMLLIYSNSASGGSCNINNNEVSNNRILGLGTLGISSVIYCLQVGGNGNISVYNNSIFNNSIPSQVSCGAYLIGINCYSSLGSQSIYSNIIHDLSIGSSFDSIHSIIGIYSNSPIGVNNLIKNNSIYNLNINLTSPGRGYITGIDAYCINIIFSNNISNLSIVTSSRAEYIWGIYCRTGTDISKNVLSDISISGSDNSGYSCGIYVEGSGLYNIHRNKISGVSMSGLSASCHGIYISSSSSTYIYNNFISQLIAPNSASIQGINGIYIASGSNVKLYYNTVYLNATSSSTGTFNSAAFFTNITSNVVLSNNILVNTSCAPASSTYIAAAYRRSASDLSTYNSASDNNCLYAGSPSANNLIYYDGTNSDQKISIYKVRVAKRDTFSFSEMPPFVNVSTIPYDLHLNTTTRTRCESGAKRITAPVSISIDIDSNIRALETGYSGTGIQPDVGGDEGEFKPCISSFSSLKISACDSFVFPGNKTPWTKGGIYYLILTNFLGCDSIITINLTVFYSNRSDTNAVACNHYFWHKHKFVSSGNYSDTLKNIHGCDSIVTLHLTINVVDTSVTQSGNTLSANASGATFQWIDCNNGNKPILGATKDTFTANTTGDYAVIITQGKCKDTTRCFHIICSSIKNNKYENKCSIQPNPTKGSFTLYYNNASKVEIFNNLGQVIMKRYLNENRNSDEFDLSEFPPGMYIVKVIVENAIILRKVIKE